MTGFGEDSNQQNELPPACYACSGRRAFGGFLRNRHEERGRDTEAGGQLGDLADVQVSLAGEDL